MRDLIEHPFCEVRRAVSADYSALADIFWQAVHIGAADHYSERQRRAWLPAKPSAKQMAARLKGQQVFTAQSAGRLTGFMSLDLSQGLLDMVYVLPARRGQGTADALWAMGLAAALEAGTDALRTQASTMARSFFLRCGWHVVQDHSAARFLDKEQVLLPVAQMRWQA